MPRVVAFIDGFNLYHALDRSGGAADRYRYRKYKWTNLWELSRQFVFGKDELKGVLCFTTLANWDIGKAARHKIFIKAQESAGVQIVFGEFKRKERYCGLCHKYFLSREEKQTDVNIAVYLFQLALQERYDKAIIVSGDTDLIPAIKAVRSNFLAKQIGVVIPIGRASEDLKKQADFHHKMREHHLIKSAFPDPIVLPDKSTIDCPISWR